MFKNSWLRKTLQSLVTALCVHVKNCSFRREDILKNNLITIKAACRSAKLVS